MKLIKQGVIVNKVYTEREYEPRSLRAWRYRANSSFDASGRKRICAGCGATEKIQIHHKNRDEKDNRQENQTPLCKKCHAKVHWNKNQGLWKE